MTGEHVRLNRAGRLEGIAAKRIWHMGGRDERGRRKVCMKKIYVHLLPFAVLSYFLAYVDRINVSFAALTMRDDRSGFRLYWRWKSRRRVGRPAVPADIRDLIRTISRDNPLWGAPRIHGELLKLGIDIAQSTVAKYMSRRHGPRSPGWQAFLRNHTAHIAGVDLFVVPTIGFKLLYGLVILRLERRRLVWTDVTANPTAEWIARQITEAFPWDEAPRYLIRDRDTSYGAAVTRRLRAMGIRDRPITPRSPWQNGHVERLIGSIRRECLDHVVVLGETAPPPSVGELRHLLQWGAHAPCARQGYPAPSTSADSRAYRISRLARRSPSALRSDGIIGRHKDRPGRASPAVIS